ncbi:MAG: hypothetical protein KAS19_06335 [Anaerolineales bacterium]|nr:hypothetical protein [Anaerolineales bacterium]
MELAPIIQQLQTTLPDLSPYFSETLSIDSISVSGTTATVTTNVNHNLAQDEFVTITGVLVPVEVSTWTEIGTPVTQIEVVTATEHDFTLSPRAPKDQNQQVRITSASFDQTYTLIGVPNRNKIILRQDSQPTAPAETLYVQEQFSRGYNGLKQITNIVSPTEFDYELESALAEPNFTTDSTVKARTRISGGIDIDTVTSSYTKQEENDLWLFVLPQESVSNKSRRTPIDAQSTSGQQGDFRQYILDGFEIYIFVPNKGNALTDTNGRFAWDLVQQIRPSIFQSVLGLSFDSGLACQGEEVITYLNDAYFDYNGAFYVHRFAFQLSIEITKDDIANPDVTRAFRDILVTHRNQFSDVTTYTSEIDLDVEPESP